jgi:hypothetical protein
MKTNSMIRASTPISVPADLPRKRPVQEVRLGSIKAAIWENTVGDIVRYNVTFSRIYKDQAEWKSSDTFGRDDLLVLAKVADQAHTWICAATKPDREPVRPG